MTEAALLNHLWQSTVFAVALAGLALLLRHNHARVRFWVWMAASLKFLIPFRALVALGGMLGGLLRWPAARTAPAPALLAVSQPFQQIIFTTSAEVAGAKATPWFLFALMVLWLAGAALLALRWWRAWRRMAVVARSAAAGSIADIRVRTTAAAIEPGVFGILRPVLLLPAGLDTRLGPAQLAAVLAHEECHLRRRDNLWSALHTLVETIFWFHPLVWYIGARLVAERERACDEEVLRRGGDRAAYAGGILQVCRYYLESPPACAAGVTGGALKQRIASILDGDWGRQLGRGRQLLLATVGAIALIGPLAVGLEFQQAAPPAATGFDAATIKPAAPQSGNRMFRGTHVDPSRFTAENMSLKDLLATGYRLKPYQIVGPAWLDTARFDVNAETSSPLPQEQMVRLLQPLLAQQFKLQTHRETKVMPVFALLVTDRSKLKPATGAGVEPVPLPPANPARTEVLSGPLPPGAFMMRMSGQALTLMGNSNMDGLIKVLASQVDRPVLNLTDLSGNYEVRLTYATPSGLMAQMKVNGAPPPPPSDAAGGRGADTDASAPAASLFTALQQLGLKLDPRKAPVELLVVDHAEKTPVGN